MGALDLLADPVRPDDSLLDPGAGPGLAAARAVLVAAVIHSITDPPLRLLRKVLRPVRIGNMMLDLAFLGLAIGVSILMRVNAAIFLYR